MVLGSVNVVLITKYTITSSQSALCLRLFVPADGLIGKAKIWDVWRFRDVPNAHAWPWYSG